jgi:hypothetical protein
MQNAPVNREFDRAPTGIDPVTFRFSVSLGGFLHCIYGCDITLIRDSSESSQLVSVTFWAINGPLMAQDRARQDHSSDSGDHVLASASPCSPGLMKLRMSAPREDDRLATGAGGKAPESAEVQIVGTPFLVSGSCTWRRLGV